MVGKKLAFLKNENNMNNILNIVLASVSIIGAFGGLVCLEKESRLMKTQIYWRINDYS